MGSISRAAALAAAALVGLQTADAGFVYSTSNRVVSAVVPSSSDTKSTSLFGNWFGSAFVSGAGVSSLANDASAAGHDGDEHAETSLKTAPPVLRDTLRLAWSRRLGVA